MKLNRKLSSKPPGLCAVLCLAVLVVFIGACQNRLLYPDRATGLDRFEKILVMPFDDLYRKLGDHASYRCPVSGKVYLIEEVAEGADAFLTDYLMSALMERKALVLIPPGQAQGAISSLLSETRAEMSELELLMKTGQQLGADAILLNRVYRFRHRVGTRYTAESPASVGLDMLLLSVPDGRLIWNGHVDEIQQTLSENLFKIGTFIKRKGQWISAEELASGGIDDALKDFPAL